MQQTKWQLITTDNWTGHSEVKLIVSYCAPFTYCLLPVHFLIASILLFFLLTAIADLELQTDLHQISPLNTILP